jgi:hypothetical protein
LNEIARPTDEELDRIEELVDEYFVGEKWGLDAKFWDDGDVHLTAYSTLGTNCNEGYPMEVINHRQVIVYQREAGDCFYINEARIDAPRCNQELNQINIDF